MLCIAARGRGHARETKHLSCTYCAITIQMDESHLSTIAQTQTSQAEIQSLRLRRCTDQLGQVLGNSYEN